MEVDNGRVVIMADDDEDDFFLVESAFKENGFPYELRFLPNGQELMDYLYRRGKYADPAVSPRPCLILLDLNMPRKDGHEVLREIKSDPELQSINVVILTTSSEEEDKALTRKLGACSFITKPHSFNELVDVLKENVPAWFQGC